MITLLILVGILLSLYVILRFTYGYRRLWAIEEMEYDNHDHHHEDRIG